MCLFVLSRSLARAHRFRADRALSAVILVSSGLLLLPTMSRSSWLGLGVGAAFVFRRTFGSAGLIKAFARAAVVAVLLVGSTLTTASFLGLDVTTLLRERLLDPEGLAGRLELADSAFKAFLDSPIFGVGRSNLLKYSEYPTAHSFYLTSLDFHGTLVT